MIYQGNLKQDCAAVQDNLKAKILRAIRYAVTDGAIIQDDDSDIRFALDGECQFFDHLLSICTAGEKCELIHEWVLHNGDTQIAVEICTYLMGKHNPLDSIAKEAATRIINHYSRQTGEAVADHEAGI